MLCLYCAYVDYFVAYVDGDPYLKHITECVQLITEEVKRQLASDTQRPSGFSARQGKRLAGSSVEAGVLGVVKRMFQGSSSGGSSASGTQQSGDVALQGSQGAGA